MTAVASAPTDPTTWAWPNHTALPQPRCLTRGCDRPTIYGGRCVACEILFGPYELLLGHTDVAEWTPGGDV